MLFEFLCELNDKIDFIEKWTFITHKGSKSRSENISSEIMAIMIHDENYSLICINV